MKNFEFINDAAKRAFKALPKDIRTQFGVDLYAVQQGERPFSPFKDISSSVGTGAIELVENGSPAYRAVYCAKYLDTVFILHAFTKTAQGTDQAAMDTAAKRYKLLTARVAEKNKLAKEAKKKKR